MGYVFQFEDALHCNDWLTSEPGHTVAAIEKDLLQRLWAPIGRQSVLEVGCGAGHFLEWFAQGGHQVAGLDPSPYMLDFARRRLPERVVLDRGVAEDLPYEDNAFDTVALITTLEFVDDPDRALQEALRVARYHVLLGVMNRYSVITWQHCLGRLWKPSIYSHARFFSVYQLSLMTKEALAGTVPVRWQTGLFFPLKALRYLRFLEQSRFLRWLPFGHFIGMRIDLRYPLRTVQHPVFFEAPSGAGPAQLRNFCWRKDKEKPRRNRLTRPPTPVVRNTGSPNRAQAPL